MCHPVREVKPGDAIIVSINPFPERTNDELVAGLVIKDYGDGTLLFRIQSSDRDLVIKKPDHPIFFKEHKLPDEGQRTWFACMRQHIRDALR